jgi:choline dehydrogenase-like flavoprotein
MLIDARRLADGSALAAHLCIIGGGMAGIAIARELSGAGADILVLESGGESISEEAQALYRGSGSMRDPGGGTRDMTDYLPSSRVRAFGGSGHVWGGKCGLLEPADFEARDWMPNSGWPFGRDALDPYYERACAHLELPSFQKDLVGGDPRRPPLAVGDGRDFVTTPRFHSMVSGAHSRQKFDAYRFGITTSPRVTVCLHANVTGIRLTEDGREVAGLEVRSLDGKRHRARADHYILATGGMENARLLLLSGIGNDRGLVGRYFAGHLNASADGGDKGPTSGVAFGGLRQPFDLYTDNDLAKVWGIWSATTAAQRRHRLPNTWVAFTRRWYPTTREEQGVLRLAGAVDGTRQGEFVTLRAMSEETPNPDSRLTIDRDARDALDQPRLRLDWRLTESHLGGMERAVALLGRALGAAGLGRLRWPLAREAVLPQLGPARHHMGATRMHTDRTKGVVDEHCRVHGVANLHIAGTSVFPTPGIVNPTLTLIALAVRLADRLRPSLRRAG